jgi:hypothetical protein
MKKRTLLNLFILAISSLFTVYSYAQKPVNWTDKQLIQPSELANAIIDKKDIPVIVSVGPGATIPNSIVVGMVNNHEGLEQLKEQLKNIDKDQKVVIYCGCCPYEHCPNVRPAIDAVKQMKFTNYFLLDLPHNIKKDWIDKGYPVSKS